MFSERVETARLLAIVLLVMYHVVGFSNHGGMRLPDGHILRLFVDALVDLRMPLFACIAGYVYGLRPVASEDIVGFHIGKLRRLALPGAVAITLFMVFANVARTPFAVGADWWQSYVTPYAHFWYLQAILVIFAVYCTFDILTRGRWVLASLAVVSGLYLIPGVQISSVLSASGALYLAPYFILGIVICRYQDWLAQQRRAVFVVAAFAMGIAAVANLATLIETGSFSGNRRDLQSLLFGLSASSLCLLYLPALPGMPRLGALSYMIYLYHVFATSGTRRVLHALDIDSLWLHVPLGIVAGIIFPVVIYALAKRYQLSRWVVLGERWQKKPASTWAYTGRVRQSA